MGSTDIQRMKLAVAASFTAEPLLDSLAFWGEKLEWRPEIEFAAYNQAFQQLLDPAGLFARNRRGANILLVRPEDWVRYGQEAGSAPNAAKLLATANEFVTAVRDAARRSSVPYLVLLCPSSPIKWNDSALKQAEDHIVTSLQGAVGVHVFSSRELLAAYSSTNYYDADRDEMGHIPFTADSFAAIGTVIVRRLNALQQPPYKVIAVDCDETLWAGVCGEVGARGIDIDAGRRAFQEFLIQQQQAGMLLCLCSKNNPEDVDEVFRLRTDMPLKREHITAARVNWNPKPGNLRELADELQLGLDSFIFIDDNPLECGQVKAAYPQVLTLSLPALADAIPQFLANMWAFDKVGITEEDRKRAEFYRQNRERDEFQQQAPSLANFLAGLELKIDISPLSAEQLSRAAQLTQRTNQFNCTTIRRTEDEMRKLSTSGEREWLTVTVSDRFGEYGLVGLLGYAAASDALKVDTFLLSCRVLGRGVEHRMLRKLGQIAQARSLARVDVQFIPSKKNAPALTFLEAVAPTCKQADGSDFVFRIPAPHAAEISESQILATAQAAAEAVKEQQSTAKPVVAAPARSQLIQEIASRFANAGAIVEAIRAHKAPATATAQADSKLTHYEQAVADVWSEVLGVSDLTSSSDFFALGGDSLLATQVISRLRQISKVRLHLQDIFEHTTIGALAECVQKASTKPQKIARTDQKQESSKVSRDTAGGEILRRQKDQSACALSFGQQRWWFLNQWAPGTADHLSLVLRLKGDLNQSALQRALDAVTDRHEVLRTRYKLVDGNPLQVILPAAPVHIAFVDLQHLPEAHREPEATQICEQEFRKAFDLSSEPILRPTLLKLSPTDHALVLVMHHIASDGWARGVLLRELESFYAAFASDKQPSLPELPVQYADYSLWQRDRMAKGDLEEQLTFYKKVLAGAPAVLELPTDFPRPSIQDLRGGVHIRFVPKDLLDSLQSLSHKEGVTLFMTLLAAYQVLLYRYSGQEDLVVGTPAAGRNHPSVEGLIGCFINMVVFRNQVRGDESFRHLLARVRNVAVAAQDNHDLPFERLVDELQHTRSLSGAPVFQAVFALENLLSQPHFPKLEVDVCEEETRTAFHDISLFVAPGSDGLRVRFEYRTDLFKPETIERMADHFENLLAAIAQSPAQTVGALPMLSEVERARLLHQWNIPKQFPVDVCIHQRFEEQVKRTPVNIAASYEGQTLSYAELNVRANQLARYLQRMGVGPDSLVGLCVERSLDMVVAILGILKAGGAYLPLDPRYPKDRLGFMVEDAKPTVVLTHYEQKDSLPDVAGQVVALDADWIEIEREDATDLPSVAAPEHLAYVIYTSGSTGRPKGCQITHANVVRLMDATYDWYKFDEHDAWTMFHSYAFDFSVWELWGALLYGGKVVVVPYLVSRSPEDFYRLLVAEKVTVLNQTPSSFRQLMYAEEMLGTSRDLALRYVIFGGEALELQSLKPWFDRHGDKKPQLVNMYGITETTVHVTYRPISVDDTNGGSVIGCAIPDLQVYILDRQMQPMPIGVPGEIYVGGAGVARGYLNRPELTAERFIPDPFQPGQKRRLYKTGDLARRLSNGDLEYLGRIDLQVKIRGFRIELGEIESVLAKHVAVREAVVILTNDASGEKRLVAYYTPQTGQKATNAELFAFLKDRLPEYMVPAAFIELERMPLNSNGKIDKKALPAADLARPERTEDFVIPETPLEEEVASVWKEVLGLERVGVNENFFEIGGHSLLATRVIMLLRSRLGLSISLRLLFEYPTIAGMATALMDTLLDETEEPALREMISEVENLSDEEVRHLRTEGANLRQNGVAAS
ncbi:MAG TPA: amino acid adenylation domain-containing protein [Terriglobales bacterium]|nr:amino acid adenylation domain-containing protein [Terriglobales bacterium]